MPTIHRPPRRQRARSPGGRTPCLPSSAPAPAPTRAPTRARARSLAVAVAVALTLSLAPALVPAPTPTQPTALPADAAADLVADPSAPNEEILRLARDVRTTPGDTKDKVERIVDLIFSEEDGLGFAYRSRPTLTAAEAVEARAGNCLTLVNLTVSIARAAGIGAEYVEVEDFETFYRSRETVVRATHVVGGIHVGGSMMYVDFLPGRTKTYRRLRPISDRRAAALFYNARAAEAVLAGDLELAGRGFRDALQVDEDSAETWNNHAILQRRRGDREGALASLERAHRLDPHLLPAIENLAGMYREAGRVEQAEAYERLALAERTRNPYFLLQQALERMGRERYDEAGDLLRRARRLAPEEPEIYVALGRVELAAGNERAAKKLFDEATRRSAPAPAGFQRRLQEKIDRLLAGTGDGPAPAGDGAGT